MPYVREARDPRVASAVREEAEALLPSNPSA
jgi:hypothetical protein